MKAVQDQNDRLGRDLNAEKGENRADGGMDRPLFGQTVVNVDRSFDDIAAIQFLNQRKSAVHRVGAVHDVGTLFKAGARFGAHTQSAGGAADVVAAEFCRLKQQLGRIRFDLRVKASHDTCKAGGIFRVGDDQHIPRQGMLLIVQRFHDLAFMSAADNDLMTLDIAQIIRVHRLSGFQHNEVGDIDDVVDAADTGASQALLHPFGRRADPEVLNHAADIAGAEVKIFHTDINVVMNVAAPGLIGNDGSFELFAENDRNLAGDPDH